MVENVEAPEIAVLARSIRHYKCLKSLTLKGFLCEFQQAKALCEALAGMRDFPLTRLLLLEPGDAESQRVLQEAFTRCKVKEKNPNLQTIITEAEKEGPMQTEEWRKTSRRPEPAIPSLLRILQDDFSSELFSLRNFVNKSVDDLRTVLRALERSVTVKCVWVTLKDLSGEDKRTSSTKGREIVNLAKLAPELKKLKLDRSSVRTFCVLEMDLITSDGYPTWDGDVVGVKFEDVCKSLVETWGPDRVGVAGRRAGGKQKDNINYHSDVLMISLKDVAPSVQDVASCLGPLWPKGYEQSYVYRLK